MTSVNQKPCVGVVGMGFVGGAVARAFAQVVKVETFDLFLLDQTSVGFGELVSACSIIFVCVPTPANEDGSCDTSVVREVVGQIAFECSCLQMKGGPKTRRTVVIKSTIPPGTTDSLSASYGSLVDVVFNPEFLNARSAYEDFMHQEHVVLGGPEPACKQVADLHRLLRSDIAIVQMTAIEAEVVKYGKNCFFATKVSYFNELYQICHALNVDYETVIDAMRRDWRVGWEHTRVPGPTLGAGAWEGMQMLGFGGACLCKDLQAFRVRARELGVDPMVMDAAWEKNLQVRPQRDWESIPSAKKQG